MRVKDLRRLFDLLSVSDDDVILITGLVEPTMIRTATCGEQRVVLISDRFYHETDLLHAGGAVADRTGKRQAGLDDPLGVSLPAADDR